MPKKKKNNIRSFTCSDCRVRIQGTSTVHGFELMRTHIQETHRREPHCDAQGNYASPEAKQAAEWGAFPEREFIEAA